MWFTRKFVERDVAPTLTFFICYGFAMYLRDFEIFWIHSAGLYIIFYLIFSSIERAYLARRIEQKVTYKTFELPIEISKTEILLNLKKSFDIEQFRDVLLIKDLDAVIEFTKDDKLRITCSEKSLDTARWIFTVDKNEMHTADKLT